MADNAFWLKIARECAVWRTNYEVLPHNIPHDDWDSDSGSVADADVIINNSNLPHLSFSFDGTAWDFRQRVQAARFMAYKLGSHSQVVSKLLDAMANGTGFLDLDLARTHVIQITASNNNTILLQARNTGVYTWRAPKTLLLDVGDISKHVARVVAYAGVPSRFWNKVWCGFIVLVAVRCVAEVVMKRS
jgi:hypothetical protein